MAAARSCIWRRPPSPRLDGEDHTKDIDFTRSGIERRWKAGHDHARKVLAEKPWQGAVDTLAGVDSMKPANELVFRCARPPKNFVAFDTE